MLVVAAAVTARPLGVRDLQHTAWTTERGAPSGGQAMTQGADGFLWLAAADGVYRFDGVSFERLPAPPQNAERSREVRSLLVTRSGDLWVGFRRGGVAIYRRGVWRDPAMPAPEQPVLAMAEDRQGRIWVSSGRSDAGVALYDKGRWTTPRATWRLPDQMYWSALVASDGAIWLGGEDGIYVLRQEADIFTRAAPLADTFSLAEAPDGSVWGANTTEARRLAPTGDDVAPLIYERPADHVDIAFDRNGALWITHTLLGVLRIAEPSSGSRVTERFAMPDGLTARAGAAVSLDREGNIWVATSTGLDRFRTTDLVRDTTIPDRPRDGYLLFSDGGGTDYFADNDSVYQLVRDAPARLLTRGIAHPGAACRQADGAVWLGTDGKLLLFNAGRLERTVATTDIPFNFYGCAVDAAGSIWISAAAQGVLRLHNGKLAKMPDFGVDRRRAATGGIAADAQGRIVVWRRSERLWRYDGDRVTRWRGGPLERIGTVSVLHRDRDAILIGGEFGLARLANDKVTFLDSAVYPDLAGIRTILTSRRGETWITTQGAVLRVPTADLDAAFAAPGRAIRFRALSAMDGLPDANLPRWNLAEAADGRIAIATADTVLWIDPSKVTHNPLPPPVAITAIVADSARTVDPGELRLTAGTKRIEIDFTALGLSRPDKVRFRYRLIGEDDVWIDPGSRRQAFYTNLAPGTYVFEVIAANESGVWNRAGARAIFTIPATFVQSWLFKVLCAALVLVIGWMFYRARLQFVTERLRNRLEARLAERERIARELHDTLLQAVQGLILRFQSVADQFPSGQSARPLLADALDRADAVLVDGRQRVRDIRASQPSGDLSEALADLGNILSAESGTRFRLVVEGSPRALHPLVRHES